MSTKVYTGLRFNTSNMHAIKQAVTQSFQPWIRAEAQHKYQAFIKHRTPEEWLDFSRCERLQSLTDTSCSLYLYPLRRSTLGVLLCANRNAFPEFLLRVPGCKDYSYWNNSDKDEGVSSSDWARRGKAWDALPNGPLRDSCFHLSLVGELDHLPMLSR